MHGSPDKNAKNAIKGEVSFVCCAIEPSKHIEGNLTVEASKNDIKISGKLNLEVKDDPKFDLSSYLKNNLIKLNLPLERELTDRSNNPEILKEKNKFKRYKGQTDRPKKPKKYLRGEILEKKELVYPYKNLPEVEDLNKKDQTYTPLKNTKEMTIGNKYQLELDEQIRLDAIQYKKNLAKKNQNLKNDY